MKPTTRQEMVTRYEVWGEYVDPAAVVEEEEFEKMSVEEKVRIIESVFGPETTPEEETE